MRNPFVTLIAVALLAGLGWVGSSAAANVAANTTLKVDMTVYVPATVRIEWGASTTLLDLSSRTTAVAGSTNDCVWDMGATDFGLTNQLSTSAGPHVLTVVNKGNPSVKVTAKITTVDTLPTLPGPINPASTAWTVATVGNAASVDKYALHFSTSGAAGPTYSAGFVQVDDTANTQIVSGFKRSSGEMTIDIQYGMPTDTNTQADIGKAHGAEVTLTAAAG